ncbi:TPA: MucBP domain-containing protein, partial [Streptococcus suis]|nr:MucBP domain-containing protein [Streptococcus suis]
FVKTTTDGDGNTTHVYKQVVTKYVDKSGNEISPEDKGTKPNKDIDGYVFTGKTTIDENGNTIHVYNKPTTSFVDENGTPIEPTEDGTTPNKSIPGYVFVKTTTDSDGNTTHVYKKVKTNFVDEEGNVISPQEDGTTPNKSINGYVFVKTTTDESGNTTHVYKKVPETTKVTTSFVDENGTHIAPTEDGTTPNKSIPGYVFVKTTTDSDGNTTHVYKKVNVVITYVDTNGLELKTFVVDTAGAADGTAYDTKQNDNEYPLYIVKGDAVYRRVLAGNFTVGQTTEDGHLVSSDAVAGAVVAGTKVVTYVYELVTIPTDKKVVTDFKDVDGNVISPRE